MILFQRKGHEVKLNAPMEISWDEAQVNAKDTECIEMNLLTYFTLQVLPGPRKVLLETLGVTLLH